MSGSSRVTRKSQAIIPARIRRVLGLQSGDLLGLEVKDGVVVLKKASPVDVAFAKGLEGTLSEWTSKEDEEAYRDVSAYCRIEVEG